MYLDLALFLVVALTAIRGLFRGFVIPVVKLTGMVSAVFLAAPLRDQVIADVQPYFARAIQPELFSKMLWWACAFLIYVVLAGVVTTVVKLIDRQLSNDFPGRGLSKALGMLLGALKGSLIAAVIAFGLVKYESSPWVGLFHINGQMAESTAVAWTRDHQPVPQVWNWMPVVALREHIYEKGWLKSIPNKLGPDDLEVADQPTDTQIAKANHQPEPNANTVDATPAVEAPKPPRVVSEDDILKRIDAKFGNKDKAEKKDEEADHGR